MSRSALESASLSDAERDALERFVELLGVRLGDDLRGVWLYGSRARGEPPHDESDIDLIIVTRSGQADSGAVFDAIWDAARESDANAGRFSTQVFTPDWIAERRAIRSFYLQEVDRDKIVLAGDP